MAKIPEFTWKAGKTNKLSLVYTDVDGNPIDITGASARMVIRDDMYSSVIVNAVGAVNGVAGEIVFTSVPADTVNVLTEKKDVQKELIGDVELTLSNGDVIDLFEEGFLIKLKQSVVR